MPTPLWLNIFLLCGISEEPNLWHAACWGGKCTILMQVQETLLLEKGLHIDSPALVLDYPLLCDDALDQG